MSPKIGEKFVNKPRQKIKKNKENSWKVVNYTEIKANCHVKDP